MYSIKEYDDAKTRILKYIIYKKRTRNEVIQKFQKEYEENLFEDVIEYLEQQGYINDEEYIQKAINNYKILKNLSIKEIRYKLLTKGLNKDLIDDYIYNNKEDLYEYEMNSANNIKNKKSDLSEQEIKQYLAKKGYTQDTIHNL